MRKEDVEEAVGLPLGHDITVDDIERLKNLGKNAVFIVEEGDTDVHEDDAAVTVAPLVAGPNVEHDPEPSEGKISFRATCDGLFRVDVDRLFAINSLAVPAFRIIPLTGSRQPTICCRIYSSLAISPIGMSSASATPLP